MKPAATDVYATLSPAACLVAQALGAVAPHRIGVTRIQKLLSQTGTALSGVRLDAPRIRKGIGGLVDAGIAARNDKGAQATPGWVLPLTRAAHRESRLARLQRAFIAGRRQPWLDRIDEQMLIRGYVVAGDFSALEALLDGTVPAPNRWEFLANPPAADLLETLPPRYREPALASCLEHVVEDAAAPEPAIDACRTLSTDYSAHIADVAFVRVLEGRFDAAEAVFEELPPGSREGPAAVAGLAATRALSALLRGDDAGALSHIEQAIAAEKAGTRKRIVFPDFRAFALSLLALVRHGTPDSIDLLNRLMSAAERLAIDRHTEIFLVMTAFDARQGHEGYTRVTKRPCLNLLLDELALGWRGEPARRAAAPWPMLRSYRDRAAAAGLNWVVAECEEVLKRSPHAGAADGSSGAAGHTRLGTTSLADLVAPVPAWERPLRTLEQFAYEAAKKSAGGTAKAVVKRRLVWEFDEDYDQVGLLPKEQRQNKSGTWSKGRKVSLARLAQDAPRMDFLRDEDRAAAAAVTVRRDWYGREHLSAGPAVLFALAGHPRVYDAEGRTLEIVRREPELTIDENAGQLTVTVEPRAGEGLEDLEYLWTMVTERRCEITRFSSAHRRLLAVVPQQGLKMPAEAKPRLLEAASSLASELRVHGGVDEAAATARQVDADPDPWVRLEPFAAGLNAALVVEPIAGSNICFEPGTGGATVFANRDGDSLQARRDLDAERGALAQLLEHCPLLAGRPTEQQPLSLPEPAGSLELLEQLKHAGARCKWPRGEPLRIVAQASAASLALTVKSAAEWMQASGKLAVDERRVLDLKRLFALLAANPGSRFLEFEPGEFLALTASFRRQLDDFASLAAPAARGAVRLHPLAALALDDLLDGAELDADSGWRDLRGRLHAAESFEPELPSTLQAELRPYQLAGFRWLARLARWRAGACLADDMGLGKTVQTLALLVDLAPEGPALVVAPTSVIANWVDEARRFAPTLNVKLYTGAGPARAELLDDPAPFDLYVTTYGVLQNDVEQLAAVVWRGAVLDEAQAIKNPVTRRAGAARQLNAGFRLVTTGTPIQNNLMDLHSLFSFINPGLLGTRQQFRRNFGFPVERDGDEEARGRLRRLIAPFVLRRLKTEVLDDLPERTEVTLHVELGAEEAALYELFRQRAVEELEAAQREGPDIGAGARKVQVLAHLTRLRLACCNPRLVLEAGAATPPSSKLRTFETTLGELLDGRHKVLVFSQFVRHLKLVEECLRGKGIAYQYLDGATPARARAERVAAFQAGHGEVFLISLKAGGIGLNLTAADYVIHLDPWWNPAVEDQASDRAHRIGQTRPVTIYRLVAEGTIEEQIVDLHRHKRDLAQQLLEGADSAARLNADELLELLRQPLRAPAATAGRATRSKDRRNERRP